MIKVLAVFVAMVCIFCAFLIGLDIMKVKSVDPATRNILGCKRTEECSNLRKLPTKDYIDLRGRKNERN